MVMRKEILDWCAQQLAVAQFRDFSPNGLQVEGRDEVNSIVCAVTASQAAIDFAVAQQADMLLVHHGMFWKNEAAAITGWKKRRIQTLLANDVNLVGYHLPLDAHQQWGNNVQLALRLGWQVDGCGGEQNLVQYGSLAQPLTAAELAWQLELSLGRVPVLLCADQQQPVRRIAWCTGGGQGFFQYAIEADVDAFITGEVSEPQYHLARECGVVFIAAGHHATERYGIQALACVLAEEFGIRQQFFDESNPA
jgi:dinuclear metal center YbgI/SA1388 family protein